METFMEDKLEFRKARILGGYEGLGWGHGWVEGA